MPKTKVPLPEINPGTVKYTATFSHIPVGGLPGLGARASTRAHLHT